MGGHAKVFMLMAGLTALLGGFGSLAGGTTGLVVATGLAAAMNVAAYFWSSKLVLRMYGARRVAARGARAVRDGRRAAPARGAADARRGDRPARPA